MTLFSWIRRVLPVRVVPLILPLVGVLLAVDVFADHLFWMQRFRTPAGGDCCSDRNCVPMPVSLLKRPAGWVEWRGQVEPADEIEVNGQRFLFPTKGVHPSQDDATWWCYRGTKPPDEITAETTVCVFYRLEGW